MSSNLSIKSDRDTSNTTTTVAYKGKGDQTAPDMAINNLSLNVLASSLPEHEPHYHNNVDKDEKGGSSSPRRRTNSALNIHALGRSKRPEPPMSVEKPKGPDGDSELCNPTRVEDDWSWLLKIEEKYVETIENATIAMQNQIYTARAAAEDENEDETQYKYYYRGPEPEPSAARIPSSEAWFAACYTDYRESYSPSDSEDGDDEANEHDADAEGETGDEELKFLSGLPCAVCRTDVCECTTSIMTGLASASLSEDQQVNSPSLASTETG